MAESSGLVHPAEEYAEVELAWAMKAHEHAQVHMNLLVAVDPSNLRLCKHDDDIYQQFQAEFPDFHLKTVTEESLKSSDAKTKWRDFINKFSEVEDYNFGTLLRLDASGIYDSDNTILGKHHSTRIQFLAIEIARNRDGINSKCKDEYTSKHRLSQEEETR